MRRICISNFATACVLVLLFAPLAPAQTPLGTGFTYQGRLMESGSPVNGNANLAFFLYNASSGGSQVGGVVVFGNQNIEAGLFTVVLNASGQFGPSAFSGERRWLEIWVNGVPLSPRQELTASPSAQYALSAPWTGLTGIPPISLLNTPQTFIAQQTFSVGISTNGLALTSSPQAGYVLTSDASGNGSWQPVPPPPPSALVPVASIVAWHKSIAGTPSLPDGWLECNGQAVTDPASPLNGQTLPNLNGDGRFLRGSVSSGTLQADDFKGHSHGLSGGNFIVTVIPGGGTQNIPSGGGGGAFGATTGTAPTGGTETRPINMTVVWIIRIK